MAAPLDRLAREFGVTVLAVQIVRLDHIIVVATASGGQTLQLSAGVGSRFPALISATGRCIAAFGKVPEAELERRFAALRWDDPPSFAQWQAQVARTREQGYAVDEGNYIAGVTVLAAPVWKAPKADGAAPTHALVALGIGAALREGRAAMLGQALVGAANSVSAQLGG